MAWIFSIFVVHMTNFIMGIWKIWPPGHFEGFFQLKSRSGFSSSKIWSKLAIFHTISLPNIKNYWKNVNYHLNFSKLNPRHHKYSQNNKNQAEEIVTKISQSYGKPIQVTFVTLLRLWYWHWLQKKFPWPFRDYSEPRHRPWDTWNSVYFSHKFFTEARTHESVIILWDNKWPVLQHCTPIALSVIFHKSKLVHNF